MGTPEPTTRDGLRWEDWRDPFLDGRIREALWRGHGHDFIYGDDGEMQCNWSQHRADFKRDAINALLDHCDKARLRDAAQPADGLDVAVLARAIDANWAELLAPLGGQPDGVRRSATAIAAEYVRLREGGGG